MATKRKPGYYWVRIGDVKRIAELTPMGWYVAGIPFAFTEPEFDQIYSLEPLQAPE